MTETSPERDTTLSLKVGRVLEAHATGWAVVVVPMVVVLVLGAGLVGLLLR